MCSKWHYFAILNYDILILDNENIPQPHGLLACGAIFLQKITTTLSSGREFYGIPAGQFYLSAFNKAKTVLK